MTAPTPITLAEHVRAHLEAHVEDLRADTPKLRVYGALDLARPNIQLPGLAAVPLGEDTDADLAPDSTETVQRVFSSIGVVVGVPAPNDPGGARARNPLDVLVRAARVLLVGWVPVRRWDPLALRRSRLLAIDGGRAWWQDDYITYGWRQAGRS